jgi:hypothetical protein
MENKTSKIKRKRLSKGQRTPHACQAARKARNAHLAIQHIASRVVR